MDTTKEWLAVYTRPRWEKKVNQLLKDKGFETYCPLNKVRKNWSDRVKIIEEPLFKSYVFVKTDIASRSNVRMTGGVLNFVYWLGKPAVISEKEINTIRRFMDDYQDVTAEPVTVSPNQEIQVVAGPLMDLKGKVLKVRGKRVEVLLEHIGYKLIAYIDRSKVKVANS